ncbi:unnamed protein product [Penicillium salamii]|uniref:DUF7728 domain-containing protein n=1 Tax=Penicillium salamii TaxID=1612424 RepID=A0A9W4NV84_9EURO|nr:unnamed protein product [Penicillium salamii]CAG8230329.1 unnamed protein product [Penicillium salamii]CAG8290667.1 unnamed protein product [Penicillium salamii]CAG8376804.1 unnamed protein product [Penicillium salamii]CAG8379298.1 unnamed protein product [Penicillium salamii]
MFLRSLLLSAPLASAMLVDPVTKSVDGFEIINPMQLDEYNHATFDLPCAECPYPQTTEGQVEYTQDSQTSLTVDFLVDNDRLLANGRQIFPPVPPTPILAVQQIEDGKHSDPVPVGYALEIMPVPHNPHDEPGYDLIDLRFTVLDVEDRPVPVDTVAISFIQAPTGEIFIARAGIEKTTPVDNHTSWKDCQGKTKCLQELLMTRIRGLLASAKNRVMGMSKPGRKGCHGKHKGDKSIHAGPHHEGIDSMPFPPPPFEGFGEDHGRPHGFSGHGRPHPHHHHGHHGAFARTFSRVVHFIVVPAILGVLAGLTASAVGMLVGQAVVFLWQRYRGTQPAEHKAAWEQGEACEKQGLMTDSRYSEEVLPEYTNSADPSEPRASMDKN